LNQPDAIRIEEEKRTQLRQDFYAMWVPEVMGKPGVWIYGAEAAAMRAAIRGEKQGE
jgi:hypothetical protein